MRNRRPRWDGGIVILPIFDLHTTLAQNLKMSDVFKSQKQWRSLIESNGRGNYRLNCD